MGGHGSGRKPDPNKSFEARFTHNAGMESWDNARENIDPHIKTNVISMKSSGAGFVKNNAQGVLTGGHFGATSLHTESTTDSLTNKTIDSFTNEVDADHIHLEARNESGSTMSVGDVVKISGFNVGLGVPLVVLADSTNSTLMPAIGIVNETILNNATGEILTAGELDGFDTSSFAVGACLYVSETAGEMTTTRPTGAALIQRLAVVLRSHASLGIISINSESRQDDLPNIADTKIWIGDTNGVPQEFALSADATMTAGGAVTVASTHAGSAHHDESHTVASHSDTTATGAELETLTDGSETTLHSHAGGGAALWNHPFNTIVSPVSSADTESGAAVVVTGNVSGATLHVDELEINGAAMSGAIVAVLTSGSALLSGAFVDVMVPYNCTIQKATALADATGSISIAIAKDTFANFPPTYPTDVISTSGLVLSSVNKKQNTALTGWTTGIARDDILRFKVSGDATTITQATIILDVLKI